MIVRLTGTLIEIAEESVVVDRDGEAREVLVPPFAINELAAYRGRVVTLHTIEFLEGNQASGNLAPRMLGFLHTEDRDFFKRFTGVKGIGPRKALRMLCEPVRRIASWIESGDTKALARLPGIGARGSELVVASLKGKMDDLALPVAGSALGCSARRPGDSRCVGRSPGRCRALAAASRPAPSGSQPSGRMGSGSLPREGGCGRVMRMSESFTE